VKLRKLPTFTKRDLLSWTPCWPRERIDAVLDMYEDEPWTALDVANRRTLPPSLISDEDRDWLLVHMAPTRVRREINTLWVARGEPCIGGPQDCRFWLRVLRAWQRGEL
jgi:hypothetical protein